MVAKASSRTTAHADKLIDTGLRIQQQSDKIDKLTAELTMVKAQLASKIAEWSDTFESLELILD